MAGNKEFIAAVNMICAEKALSADIVYDIIESAIGTAYRKEYGQKEQKYKVNIDRETGDAQIFLLQEVMATAQDIENPAAQIELKAASRFDKSLQVGDMMQMDVTPTDPNYGRIAAQSAKQVILQKIQEAERVKMYETFKEREDEIIMANIVKIDADKVILEIEKNLIMLPRGGQVNGERYLQGHSIKIYLERVRQSARGPELIISRRHPRLVMKLFEQEIPEIIDKLVEIKGIARKAGVRTKIAMASNSDDVDPVGACIGQRGMRIATILNELGSEKIDVIEWAENPEDYLRNALEPAKIEHIDFIPDRHRAIVYVAEDQRAIAVGRQGQNVDLASELTGWTIDLENAENVGKLEEVEQQKVSADNLQSRTSAGFFQNMRRNIAQIEDLGLSEKVMEKLTEAGIISLEDLHKVDVKWLAQVKGVSQQMAEDLIDFLDKNLSKETND